MEDIAAPSFLVTASLDDNHSFRFLSKDLIAMKWCVIGSTFPPQCELWLLLADRQKGAHTRFVNSAKNVVSVIRGINLQLDTGDDRLMRIPMNDNEKRISVPGIVKGIVNVNYLAAACHQADLPHTPLFIAFHIEGGRSPELMGWLAFYDCPRAAFDTLVKQASRQHAALGIVPKPPSDLVLRASDGKIICGVAEFMPHEPGLHLSKKPTPSVKRPREEKEPSDELACVVCHDARKDTMPAACRHVCCCAKCAATLKECPMCRTAVSEKDGTIKVFL